MKNLLLALALTGSALAEEFACLFDGKDLAHWGAPEKTEHNGYQIKDGTITSTPKCRVLMTDKEFTNYVFQFEFLLTPGANNGLGIHYPGTGDGAYTGMELQILDDTHPKYKELKDYQFHGSLYTLAPAKTGHLKPVGEWNQQTVTVNGSLVKVELNGTVILEANLDELNLAHPKHEGAKRRSGRIAFLGHGDIVSYRNLKIKELKAE